MKINFLPKPASIPKPVRLIFDKYTIYILPTITGIIILILLISIVGPRIGEIFQLRTRITQLEQKVKILDNKLLTLKAISPDQLLTDVKKAEISLPSEKDLPSLLSALERLSAETGVGIVAVQLTPGEVQPATGEAQAEEIPVKMTIAGNFFQVKNFLANIINSPRTMAVRSATLTSGLGGQQASLSATLNLESFFQILSATKFTVEEPLQSLTAEEKQILTKITVLPIQVTPTTTPTIPTGKADPFAPF